MTSADLSIGNADPFALRERSVADLLLLYANVLSTLRDRGVLRSSNNPVADYSEWLVARALGLRLVSQSVKGHDAVAPDGTRYQIKGRRATPTNGSRQLSAIRGLEVQDTHPFDYLVGVLYNFDFTVMKAAQIPIAIVRQQARPAPHVNGWRFILRDSVWALPGVIDVSGPVQAAALRQ